RDACPHAVGDASNNNPAIAMADQNHIVEVFENQDVHHVLNVGAEADGWREEVRPLAEPGEGGSEDLMSGCTQQRGHLAPAPTAMPGAMDEHKRCHPITSGATSIGT